MKKHRRPFDMSLRLWSDNVPLDAILESAGLSARHVHVKGQPSAPTGVLAKRLAPRHYAMVEHSETDIEAEIEIWLSATLQSLSGTTLQEKIRDGKIEAVVWISILGDVSREIPVLGQDLIQKTAVLGVHILIENYTQPEKADPFPEKKWLIEGTA